MLESPEIEAHRHKTGHSHLDLILGGLAVFLSMVSVFIAVRHGETMERLVAANSWPNISYATGNETGSPGNVTKTITLSLRNTGVGPARIDSFEVFYKDQPVAGISEFFKLCCHSNSPAFATSSVLNEVLPARDDIEFITLPAAGNSEADWQTLNRERFHVRVRVCYCSVFDECWVRDTATPRPVRTGQCAPSQPVQYRQ
jgi:hypothetical protein